MVKKAANETFEREKGQAGGREHRRCKYWR